MVTPQEIRKVFTTRQLSYYKVLRNVMAGDLAVIRLKDEPNFYNNYSTAIHTELVWINNIVVNKKYDHLTKYIMTVFKEPYPEVVVRFDWRNPFWEPDTHKMLADEILPDQLADLFIDVKEARKTAARTFSLLSDFLAEKDIVIYDLCLFISEDGKTVYGEISPDCGRYRHFDLGSLDKDVWRAGGSSEQVIEKWNLLYKMIMD